VLGAHAAERLLNPLSNHGGRGLDACPRNLGLIQGFSIRFDEDSQLGGRLMIEHLG
jgi:hypothetical protein